MYYKLAKVFNLTWIVKETHEFIASFFTTISKTKSFLELDFSLVKTILSSSQLEVDSELEILSSVNEWLCYDYENRSKYAKDLLLAVRLHLLQDRVLTEVISGSHSCAFQLNVKLVEVLKEILRDKKKYYDNKRSLCLEARHCPKTKFNLVVFGGEYKTTNDGNLTLIDGKNFGRSKFLAKFPKCDFIRVANVKNVLYLTCIYKNKTPMKFLKYNFARNAWKSIRLIKDDRVSVQPCSFFNKIYFLGGFSLNTGILKSCFALDTTDYKIVRVKEMHEFRWNCACAVFRGRIVVSGGRLPANINSNTVEAYDHVSNTWSHMPNMVFPRSGHAQVAVGNKIYVFGGITATCEVFDSFSNSFSVIKPPSSLERMTDYDVKDAFLIGRKIMMFRIGSTKLAVYDLDTSKWSEVLFEAAVDVKRYTCTKLAKI